jgi:hypothetical protein
MYPAEFFLYNDEYSSAIDEIVCDHFSTLQESLAEAAYEDRRDMERE